MANILGMKTPFSQWVDPRRDMLMGAAAGLAGGGLPGMWQGAMQGRAIDQQAAERARELEQQTATMEWVKQNAPQFATLPPAMAFEAAMKQMAQAQSGPGDNLRAVGGHLYDVNSGQWISPPETAENRQNVSLTPQWGQDAQGNWVMLQPSSTGELVQSTTPEGVSLVGPYDLSAQKAAGAAFGKNTGAAQFDLPSIRLMADQTLKAVSDVKAESKGMEEQFGNVLGVIPQQMIPAWPKTDKAKFQVAAKRLQDRAFLDGRELLRGGGPITDFESRKAESAITNMEDAIARGDMAQFQKGLDDFEQAVRDGVAKLEAQAGAMPGYGGGTPASSGNTTSSGVTWKVK